MWPFSRKNPASAPETEADEMLRRIMKCGDMIPTQGIDGQTVLVVRETDAGISSIGLDPVVYTMPVTIEFRSVRLVFVLLRLGEQARHTYEVGFDLTQKHCNEDLLALTQQSQLTTLVVGDTTTSTIVAPASTFAVSLGLHTDRASTYNLEWTPQEFSAALTAMHQATESSGELFSIVEQIGPFLHLEEAEGSGFSLNPAPDREPLFLSASDHYAFF